ncbi:succinylglutamate desuccinylase/aspartoacylase family protein [Methanothermobacter wolfeii]|uniref:succinylglutamate desuccinylase/aspartoacylase family protein n=1 Tax=Methanothermobacter wolfeii TaxID=145261 RepID=UPI0024B3A47A|nr:succinylglutamate desuccinylase/aspartoacylase family protein [Methanothermobacter wolfeii]MDI6702273.1 succinylglutamate desuccinylase/aspartoacylase family protein [Methanothermobacter wolfeii]
MKWKILKPLTLAFALIMLFSNVQLAAALQTEIIYTGTGGDVARNYYVKKYSPKTSVTSQVFQEARKGTPMFVFGNGSGRKVIIVAGVHGNELPASIAAVKLINYLSGRKINGTVYVVPFLIPSSTARSYRYWNGKNPNSIANIPGTPTGRIVQIARERNVKAVGDFHSTRPGGVPGRTSILCTRRPTYESYTMASYMSRYSASALIPSQFAGRDYPGALEDVCNLQGIPAVTAEVRSPHGYASSTTVAKSYSQMIGFLKYNRII